jgi:hydroxyacyl-ACP dehydratase HTD2-like protein with hotdog domain
MWAGGQLTWSQGNRLRVGDTVTESTKVLSADAKVTKAGEQMIVVRVEKEFSNETGVALTDERNWVFRPAVEEGLTLAVKERAEEVPFRELGEGETAREYTQSHVDLFRFSAVTFNAHKIHYNREWCRGVEGHRECVVHGPLNLILMVDLWRGVYGGKGEEVVPKRVSYRATNPVYAGDRYRVVVGKENEQKVAEVGVEDCFGNVNMKGLIERW